MDVQNSHDDFITTGVKEKVKSGREIGKIKGVKGDKG